MDDGSLLVSPSEDEIAVAQILLDLPDIIERSSIWVWGATRKKRSVPDGEVAPSTMSFWKTHGKPAAVDSPDTSLSLLSKDKKFKNNFTNKARAEYVNSIQELTRARDFLLGEIERVNKHYAQLTAYNSELKAMKQVLTSNPGHQAKSTIQPQPPFGAVTSNPDHQATSTIQTSTIQPQLSFGAVNFQFTAQFYSPAFTDRQASLAQSAEARRLRKEIMKAKSMRTRKH